MKRILQTLVLVCCVLGLSWLLAPSALAISWPDDIYVSDLLPLPTNATGYIITADSKGNIKYVEAFLEATQNIRVPQWSTADLSKMINMPNGIYAQGYDAPTVYYSFNTSTGNWTKQSGSNRQNIGNSVLVAYNVYINNEVSGNPIQLGRFTGNNIPLIRVDYTVDLNELSNKAIAEAVINELGSFFPYYFWNGDLTGGTIYLARDMRIDKVVGSTFTLSGTNVLALEYTVTQTSNGYTIGFLTKWHRPDFDIPSITVAGAYTNADTLDVDGTIATGLIRPWMEYEDAFIAFAGSGQTTTLQDILIAIERQTTLLRQSIEAGTDEITAAIQQQTLDLIEYFNELYGSGEQNQASIEQVQDKLEEYQQMEQQAFDNAKSAYEGLAPELDLSFTIGNPAKFLVAITWINIKLNEIFIGLGEWQFVVYIPLIIGLVLFSISIGSRYFNAKGRR